LIVPGIYTLQNSVGSRPGTSSSWAKEVGSIYGYVDLDFKNYLFLSATGRMDKSSTLPLNNNTYFYPSVSLSAVVSDMFDVSPVFSFLRLRGSYANVGGDIGVYELNNVYTQGVMWNGQTPMYMGSQMFDANIKPEFSSSFEIGTDMRFFNNRLGLDVAYYSAVDGPQIFSLPTPSSSGFDTRKLNGLTYTRQGIEISATAVPVKTKSFSWDLTANVTTAKRLLKDVYGDVNNLGNIKKGERLDQIWGQDFMRSAEGQVIYQNGMPLPDPINKMLGYEDPNFFFGLTNRFSYKDLSLSFSLDGSQGGSILNDTWMNLWKSGRHEDSDNEWRLADWEAYKNNPAGFGTEYTGIYVAEGVVVTGGDLRYPYLRKEYNTSNLSKLGWIIAWLQPYDICYAAKPHLYETS
jgi:outer membrane receptor protein involved in Fe transport